MKLVIWNRDPYPTAPGVYLGSFPRRGHEVVWVSSTTGEHGCVRRWQSGSVTHIEVVRRADRSGWRPLAILRNRVAKLGAFFRKCGVVWEQASERPDVLQVRDLVTEGVLAWLAARRFGLLFAYQFDYPHYRARLSELDRRRRVAPGTRLVAHWWIGVKDFLLRRADLVLPISHAMADHLVSRLGLSPSRLTPFPVGIAPELFEQVGVATPPALPGLDPARPIVAYAGNLSPIRRPEFLFEVAAEILRQEPSAQFLLIGPSNPVADRLMESFPHRDRLVWAGQRPREELLALLRHADVALFPLPVEDDPYSVFRTSSPLKVIEYLSAGVPVVSSRVGDAIQVLEESGGGVTCESRVDAFAAAAVALLRDGVRARAMGTSGRAWVGRHRSFDALAEAIEPAYVRALADRASRAARRAEGGARDRWVS